MSSKTRVLIADDDPVYLEVSAATLADAGYSVTGSVDGKQAVIQLSLSKFDLAIIDLKMPGLDGLDVIRAVRSNGPNSDTPLIVMTGADDAASISDAFEAGATSFITKPVNWLLFTKHVQFVLRTDRVATELRDSVLATRYLSNLNRATLSSLAKEFQAPSKRIYSLAKIFEKEAYGPLPDPAYRSLSGDIAQAAVELNTALLRLLSHGSELKSQLEISQAQVKMREMVDDAVAIRSEAAARRNVAIRIKCATGLVPVAIGDPVLLAQTFNAILDHALKWAPKNSTIDIALSVDPDGNLVVRMQDRGAPLSEWLLAEINGAGAKPVSMFSAPATRELQIGVAKVLIEAHQGRISIASDETNGTIVSLLIPAARMIGVAGAQSGPQSDTPQAYANEPPIARRCVAS